MQVVEMGRYTTAIITAEYIRGSVPFLLEIKSLFKLTYIASLLIKF